MIQGRGRETRLLLICAAAFLPGPARAQVLGCSPPASHASSAADASGVIQACIDQTPLNATLAFTTRGKSDSAPSGTSLSFGQVYVYPNPSTRNTKPVFHIELAGSVDTIEFDVYDAAGAVVDKQTLPASAFASPAGCPAGVACYERPWDDSREASGVYSYAVKASEAGVGGVTKTGKLAIVK